MYLRLWEKLDEPEKLKHLEVPKNGDKKKSKKKDDSFKPGIDN